MGRISTYNQTINCTPTENFLGRFPHNALASNSAIHCKLFSTKFDVTTLVNAVKQNNTENVSDSFKAFQRYKNYYERKAQAPHLKVGNYTFLFNPKYNIQLIKTQFKTIVRNSPYKFLKVFSHSKSIVRKTGTYKTQYIHRLRLRCFIPHENVPGCRVDEYQSFSPIKN